MTRDELTYRAAFSRFGVGIIAVTMLSLFYPRTREFAWVWAVYLGVATVEQVLIRKRIGGHARSLVAGLADTAMLTFIVHELGSSVTPIASLYFFAAVANALVVDLRVAIALAAVNALAYDALLWAEWARLLAFAPSAPNVQVLGPPSLEQTLIGTVFVTGFVFATTAIVGMLVNAVQKREEQLVEANARLEELSQRDPLTNLYNRRHLFARVEAELARVKRGHALAIVMIDLDGFKRVNDAQGHLRGDALLRDIATALAATTRVTDVAGRYGGDEFLLVLPDTDEDQARKVAERVGQSVRDATRRFDEALVVTASVGVAIGSPADSVAVLMKRADENAYRAKQQGGDRVVA